MEIKDICWLVYVIIALGFYVVSTALAIKRKKAVGLTQDEYDTFLKTEINRVVNYISRAELKYKSVFREGVKAGEFKLKDVLDSIKEDCFEVGSLFDRDFWINTINNIVECMNYTNKSSVQTENKTNIKGVTL